MILVSRLLMEKYASPLPCIWTLETGQDLVDYSDSKRASCLTFSKPLRTKCSNKNNLPILSKTYKIA